MTGIVETMLTSGPGEGLVGVLCEPDRTVRRAMGVGIVFLNAGNTHHVGPNRLYVTLSRTLARHGFTSCRFDLSGLGDSPTHRDGRKLRDYAPLETRWVMNELEHRSGLSAFILVGICGGADIAFDVASSSDQVIGTILINGAFVDGNAFAQAYHKAERKTVRRFYRRRMFSWRGWARVLTMRSSFWKGFMKKFLKKPKERFPVKFVPLMEEAQQKWTALAERNMEILMIFSEGSVFGDMFHHQTKNAIFKIYTSDKLQVMRQKAADHTFTLLSSQQILTETILSWLKEKLPCGMECQ